MDSPPFLNAVLELSIAMEPQDLLRKLKNIENALGRQPSSQRNGPRIIDIDLLYCENLTISSPGLTLPHPQIARRRFVLQPLADIRPKLILPNFSKNVEELLQELTSDEVVSVYCDAIY